MLGARAKALLEELKRSDFLPAYNVGAPSPHSRVPRPATPRPRASLPPARPPVQDEGVRVVVEEVRGLSDEIDRVFS